jgi:hypothetical protein
VPHVEVSDLFVKTVVEFLNSKNWLIVLRLLRNSLLSVFN